MCGACGRTVVADPALGSVRTTRDMLIAAQLVNSIAGVPGGPVVRVMGDSWMLAGRTGRSTACDTVHQCWRALVDHSARVPGATSRIADQLARGLPAASPLADRVLREGISALEDLARSSSTAGAGTS